MDMQGSMLTRKLGPLPTWVYMALLLLLALGYSLWKRNKDASTGEGPATDTTDTGPGDQTPPPVFILPQAPQPTVQVINNPPGTPVTAPPVATKPPPRNPAPIPKPPAKPAVAYDQIKVVAYTDRNPDPHSTLWGIAKEAGFGSAANNYASIWNDPRNAALKAKRKSPNQIRPGDIVWVRRR